MVVFGNNMKLQELQHKLKHYPLFTLEDIFKWFPQGERKTTVNQLSRWVKQGYLESIKRGVYKLRDYEIKDSLLIANFIYAPSYVSLESALNYYSIIPDIPFAITSLTLKKTKQFETKLFGVFIYSHIKPALFFGFESVMVEQYSYSIARPEKALFDFLYLRAHTINPAGFPDECRFSIEKDFNWSTFKKYCMLISNANKKFHQLKTVLLKRYAS